MKKRVSEALLVAFSQFSCTNELPRQIGIIVVFASMGCLVMTRGAITIPPDAKLVRATFSEASLKRTFVSTTGRYLVLRILEKAEKHFVL